MPGNVKRVLLTIVAVLAAVIVIGVIAVGLMSKRVLANRYEVTPGAVTIPTDSASIARGRHLASAIAKCTDCHGEDLRGQSMAMGPMGTFPAVNLTTGKGGRTRTDAEWVRAIHHGVGDGGRPLVFMPSGPYSHLSASDLGAIIAWVKSMPPVDNEVPPLKLGPIGKLLIAKQPARLVAAIGIDHSAPLPPDVPVGPTAEYGAYLAVVGGCTYCHGDNLAGGIKEGPPGTPASANLRPDGPTATWTEADFTTALRTGKRPDGTDINPFMPWRLTRLMTDEEIQAVWAYLRSLK
ncbi:MAG TPA: cytochrome c [Gemmatimonadales bacterium]|nr:cytochrome c [Gemmatimonadales bacterium]